jgi:hypothetical protein
MHIVNVCSEAGSRFLNICYRKLRSKRLNKGYREKRKDETILKKFTNISLFATVFSIIIIIIIIIRNSVVGIATRLRGSNPGRRMRFLYFLKGPDRLWGPSSLLFSGYRRSLQRIKRPARAVNYSPPSSAELKNEWN